MIVGIINPARRNAAAIEYALRDVCRDAGLPVPEFLYTTVERPGAEQALRAVRAGASRVIVAGGDGTVRQVASALAGTRTALAIVPTGTANLFALNLGLRRRGRGDANALHGDLETALHGAVARHDIGYVRWIPSGWSADVGQAEAGHAEAEAGQPGARREAFLAAAGMGLDATTVAETTEEVKERLGWAAYLVTGSRHLREPPREFSIRLGGEDPQEVRAWSILLGNTPRIPAGLTVFPSARSDSGSLELLRVSPAGLRSWLGIAFHGLRRRPRRASALAYRTVQRVRVSAADPVALQLDGDFVGSVHRAEFWVEPACLRVVTPAPVSPSPSPGAAPGPGI